MRTRTGPPFEEQLAVLVTMALALWSALATLFTFAGLSFRTLCLAYTAVLPLGLLLLVRYPLAAGRRRDEPARESTNARWMLLGLCLLGAALSFLEHRPNPDDGYYFAGRTIHYLAHPEAVLDLEHHHHALLDWPLRYPLLLLQHLSLLWGYLGFVTGLSGLDILHYVAPTLGGFLLPLAWYLALSRFLRSPLAAVTGTAAIVACLCLDGVTSRSFGAFGFPAVRLGKGLLMAVFVPIFVAFSRDWFVRPGAQNAVKLFLVTIACAGLSDSSLFLLPVLAAFLASGCLFARGASLATLKLLAGYFASLAWLYGIGMYVLAVVDRSHMAHLGFGYGFPGFFSGQLALVFGDPPGPFLWIYLLALAVAWIALRDGEERAFLAGWTLAALALLNPLLFPLLTSHLTSYNGFWRLFYLPPFLLAVGIAIAGLVAWLGARRPAHHVLAIVLLLGVTVLGNLVEPLSSRAVFSRIPLAVTGYKIDADLQEDVRVILARAEPGATLAPVRYSEVIPLFTDQLPQVAVRGFMLRHSAIANGEPELAESRMRAVGLVSGRASPGAVQDLEKLLAREELTNVVVSARVAARPALLRLLRRHGFERVARQPRFALFVRIRDQMHSKPEPADRSRPRRGGSVPTGVVQS